MDCSSSKENCIHFEHVSCHFQTIINSRESQKKCRNNKEKLLNMSFGINYHGNVQCESVMFQVVNNESQKSIYVTGLLAGDDGWSL